MPSWLKSATRTTWAGLWVWIVTGLAKRPPPRPASTSSVFEPGLIVTRSVRTARGERPGGDTRRRFQAGDLGRAGAGSISDNPVPAR